MSTPHLGNEAHESRLPLMDAKAVAAYTRLSLRTAHRLLTDRELPVIKIGRSVRVRAEDLDAYLARNTRPAVDR